eukprot:4057105-Amphidinium_carterae.1
MPSRVRLSWVPLYMHSSTWTWAHNLDLESGRSRHWMPKNTTNTTVTRCRCRNKESKQEQENTELLRISEGKGKCLVMILAQVKWVGPGMSVACLLTYCDVFCHASGDVQRADFAMPVATSVRPRYTLLVTITTAMTGPKCRKCNPFVIISIIIIIIEHLSIEKVRVSTLLLEAGATPTRHPLQTSRSENSVANTFAPSLSIPSDPELSYAKRQHHPIILHHHHQRHHLE